MKRVLSAFLICVFISGCGTSWTVKYGIDEKDLYQPVSIPKLTAALKDENPRVRTGAIRCLYKFDDPSVAEALKEVAQSDSDEGVRKYAAGAINASAQYEGINRVTMPVELSIGESKVEIGIQPSSVFYTTERNVLTIHKLGLLPVKITLKNLSEASLAIDPLFFKLTLPSGGVANALNYTEVEKGLKLDLIRDW